MNDAAVMPTIVIADDEPDLLLLVSVRLRRLGYSVLTATDGLEALEIIREHTPQMAVLDVMMPGLTGTEVLAHIRSDPATRDMLVVLMSAGFTGETDESGMPVGADDFLHKPFRGNQMGELVAALLERGTTPPS
jgi:CheY-like chemotaxis protein